MTDVGCGSGDGNGAVGPDAPGERKGPDWLGCLSQEADIKAYPLSTVFGLSMKL